MNHTDERIWKLYGRGLSYEQIARKIGRPGDIDRVRAGLARKESESLAKLSSTAQSSADTSCNEHEVQN